MTEIYMNWAATANKRPQRMLDAVCDYLQGNNNNNAGRGLAKIEEAEQIFNTRLSLAEFFNAPDSAHVLFTPNVTTALNMILQGILETGDHVVTTSIEHNAVARPLHLLEKRCGVIVSVVSCDKTGTITPEQIEKAITAKTKVLVMIHASNVLGTILPIKQCFEVAKRHGVITVLDSAQTAGLLPIDMEEMQIDVLAFTGHKNLLALPGIGGFVLREEIEDKIAPWLVGGTGSASSSLDQPTFLPDKYEAGTANFLGILSLNKSLEYINRTGIENIYIYERQLTERFLTGLMDVPVTVLGTGQADKSVPVVSLISQTMEVAELAQALYDDSQIITRWGLHCAPLAHRTAGTFSTGSVRFSFGYATTVDEIDQALQALKQVLKK